jgi:2,4-diketo-3-deoxy-L-fuconate hydrolase
MRILTYEEAGRQRVGVLAEGAVVDVSDLYPSVLAVIQGGEEAKAALARAQAERAPALSVEEARLLAPIPVPPRNVHAVGWNYLRHFDELKGRRGRVDPDLPDYPNFFTKASTTVVGPQDDVPLFVHLTEKFDYEAELAVVIGRGGRDIPPERALEHVFGYMAANDLTARDLQHRSGLQFYKGKSLDGSCPTGPWLVTREEIPDPQRLTVYCQVNGEERQRATTEAMLFTVAELIAYLSQGMTLLPGDILLTGTPAGVGHGLTPPVYLQPGDLLVTGVAEIGELRNRVVAHDGRG